MPAAPSHPRRMVLEAPNQVWDDFMALQDGFGGIHAGAVLKILLDTYRRMTPAAPVPKPICQYCLASSPHTPLGPDKDKRCPVCGSAYSGPRRSEEFRLLLEAGFVSKGD